jgi:hypothetical protein
MPFSTISADSEASAKELSVALFIDTGPSMIKPEKRRVSRLR